MATPACRVLAGSQALGLGGVQNALKAPTYPARGFPLGGPDGLQRIKDVGRFDVVDRLVIKKLGVGFECVAPLLPMLGIAEVIQI